MKGKDKNSVSEIQAYAEFSRMNVKELASMRRHINLMSAICNKHAMFIICGVVFVTPTIITAALMPHGGQFIINIIIVLYPLFFELYVKKQLATLTGDVKNMKGAFNTVIKEKGIAIDPLY